MPNTKQKVGPGGRGTALGAETFWNVNGRPFSVDLNPTDTNGVRPTDIIMCYIIIIIIVVTTKIHFAHGSVTFVGETKISPTEHNGANVSLKNETLR